MVQIQERDAELRGEKRDEKRGEKNASLRIAKRLLLSNLSVDAIANACDLTAWQALAIKAQIVTN